MDRRKEERYTDVKKFNFVRGFLFLLVWGKLIKALGKVNLILTIMAIACTVAGRKIKVKESSFLII